MPRVKRSIHAKKKRKKVLKYTKGFKWGRKSKYKAAKEALMHAWTHAYRDRRRKKRDFRQLWQIKINAASRENNMPYNKFIHGVKTAKIALDRKILANIAEHRPRVFKKIAEFINK